MYNKLIDKYLEFKKIVDSVNEISKDLLVNLFSSFGDLETIEYIERYIKETGLENKFESYFNEFYNNKLIPQIDDNYVSLDNYIPDKNIQEYLKSIGNYELLTSEQEITLSNIVSRNLNFIKFEKISYESLTNEIKKIIPFDENVIISNDLQNDYNKLVNCVKLNTFSINKNNISKYIYILESILSENINNNEINSFIKKMSIARDYYKSRDKLITSNLKLVVSIARKYRSDSMEIDDLIQEGNIGLMKAIEKFDPTKGFKFSTYATWWIRQAVTRSIYNNGRMIRIPVNLSSKLSSFRYLVSSLELKLGREPNIEEIAKELKLEYETDVDKQNAKKIIEQYYRYMQYIYSLDNTMKANEDGDETPLLEFVKDEYDTIENFERNELKNVFEKFIIDYLTKNNKKSMDSKNRDVVILVLRFGINLSKYISLDKLNEYLQFIKSKVNDENIGTNRKQKYIYVYNKLINNYKHSLSDLDDIGDEFSLEEIGIIFGLTRERIRQIEFNFLKYCKNYFIKNANDYIDVDLIKVK